MSSPASITPKESASPAPATRRKRWLRKRVLLAVLLAGLLVCLVTPAVFRLGVRYGLILAARQRGIDLTITKIKGSVFEPVALYGVKLSAFSKARTETNLEIARADLDFSLARIVFRKGEGCLRSVSIDGLDARVKFEPGGNTTAPVSTAPPPPVAQPQRLWPEKLIPARISATHVNVMLEQSKNFVRLENLHCSVSDVEPGEIGVEKILIHQPWLMKTFPFVKGMTAMQNSKISIANVSLEKNVTIVNASTYLTELANGWLKIDFSFAAFGGSIDGAIRSTGPDLHSGIEANGRFAQISVAPLAAFFSYPGESGGVIKEGKFNFNGSLRDLGKSTLSLRLDAADFRLGKRQWNSLTGGAEMVEHRIEIHDLHLQQAHNELSLKGRMALPAPGVEWWQSEFAFDASAKIDNLTELSALFGQGFAEMAGKITVDGSIKGSNQSFSGDLAVSGSSLSYRNAPIDALYAAIHLNGNELQVADLELTSKGDFLRGKGVVNILGQEKRYWGDLKASVAELSRYSAILQKPIVPQPLAGGLTVEWSGDGVSKAHSGAFHAQLKKFRLISVTEPKAHPLNADMEATYSPGNIFFSKFLVWDNDTNFSAKVTATPKTLNLQSIRLQQNNAVWLEGDALLPFNVWSAWENASWNTLLVFESPCKVNVTATGLDLRKTSLLSGRQLPVKGELDMSFTADGTLNDLKTDGNLHLKKAEVTLGETEPDVIAADGDVVFQGQDLKVEKSTTRFNAWEFGTQGTIHLKNLRDPDFDANVRMKKVSLTVRDDVKIDTDLDLNVRGTYSQATVSGTAQLLDVKITGRQPDVAGLLTANYYNLKLAPVLPFDAAQSPLGKWLFDVALTTPQPVKILRQGEGAAKYESAGSIAANFSARGAAQDIRISGVANIQDVPVTPPDVRFAGGHISQEPGGAARWTAKLLPDWTITNGTFLYSADGSPVWFAFGLSGKFSDYNIAGKIFGREGERTSVFLSDPPLPQIEIYKILTLKPSATPPAESTIGGHDISLKLNDFSPAPEAPVDLRMK